MGRLLPVAWGIYTAETHANWKRFFESLQVAMSENLGDDAMGRLCFISDRHPGLLLALREVFGDNKRHHCAKHIKDNLKTRFNLTVANLFWQAARAITQPALDGALEQLQAKSQPAWEYVQSLDEEGDDARGTNPTKWSLIQAGMLQRRSNSQC